MARISELLPVTVKQADDNKAVAKNMSAIISIIIAIIY